MSGRIVSYAHRYKRQPRAAGGAAGRPGGRHHGPPEAGEAGAGCPPAGRAAEDDDPEATPRMRAWLEQAKWGRGRVE
jgi:hypothetical protein